MSLAGWANHFRHGVSKAIFSAVDHHAWNRLMRWIRAKYAGKSGLSMKQMRRRFCDAGWRFACNGVVFTGASSVKVTRYRYRGGNIPTPWTPGPPPRQAADDRAGARGAPGAVKSHAGCGGGIAGNGRWQHRNRARGPTQPASPDHGPGAARHEPGLVLPADRAFLAALLHRSPRDVLGRLPAALIRPDTVLRWHRNLLARRHAARSRPRRPGRPRTVRSIRLLVLRPARENPCWGYRRIHGELLVLGIKTAASTVWEILHDAGIDPAPGRASTTWADFLRSQADAVLACDFFETVTVTGVHLFVLAVIEHARRRIRVLGATAHPTASWVVQAARNLVMDLEDAGSQARFLIRDRDGKFPDLFNTVLKDAGIEVVLSGVQMPRMNAIMERWVQTCRRELLDRTLIWNQAHLLHALREFGQFYNSHRPHQGIANARPLRALPSPIPGLDATTRLHVHRHDHLGGILHEYRHAALPARMRFSASTGPTAEETARETGDSAVTRQTWF